MLKMIENKKSETLPHSLFWYIFLAHFFQLKNKACHIFQRQARVNERKLPIMA